MSKDELIELSKTDIKRVDKNTLINIETITVDHQKPIDNRIETYIKEIHNPYIFLCEGRVVKIGFLDNGKLLDEAIKNYLFQLHSGA